MAAKAKGTGSKAANAPVRLKRKRLTISRDKMEADALKERKEETDAAFNAMTKRTNKAWSAWQRRMDKIAETFK